MSMALAEIEVLQPVNSKPLGESDSAELQAHLNCQPAWVQNSINDLMRREYGRSFNNVAGQVKVFREIMSEVVAVNQSEEAEALRQLLRDIQPATVKALENGADAIEREMSQLKQLIRCGDFTEVGDRAKRLEGKTKRFQKKFADLRPKLNKLRAKLEAEARKLEAASKASEDLFIQTENHRDWWLWFLDFLGKSATVGSASLLGISAGSIGYLYYLYQCKAMALGSAKATLAAAKKALADKGAAASAATARATAAKAAAAHDAAVVTTANHTLQGAGTAEVAATGASSHGGAHAVAAVIGGSAAVDMWLVHSADVAQVAYQAASAAAAAASNAAGAASAAMSGAAAEAASALSNMDSLQVAMGSLSTTMCSIAPLTVAAGAVLALCMIGYAGRDLVKRMLSRLWTQELKKHQEMKELFAGMAQRLRDGLGKLKTLSDNAEKMEQALTLVAEVAEELAGQAEDVDIIVMPDDMDMMEKQVDELAGAFEGVCEACSAFQDSLNKVSEVNFIANEARVAKVPEFLQQQPTLCLENGTEFPHGSPLELCDGLTSSDHSWEFVDQDVSDLPSEAPQIAGETIRNSPADCKSVA